MKIQNFTQTNADDSTTDFVIIDKGNGEFTSMLKSTYDEQQKALKESLVIDEPAAKSK